MDVHQRLDPCAVERPSVDHWSLLQLILRIDLVNHLQDQLLHHKRTRFRQVYALVKLHALCLLGLPDLLRNGLAKPSIDLNIGELEFLVQLVEVLVIDDHKHVALWEDSLLELVVEFLLLGSERAAGALLDCQALDPLHLFLALLLLVQLESGAAPLSQGVLINLAARFRW